MRSSRQTSTWRRMKLGRHHASRGRHRLQPELFDQRTAKRHVLGMIALDPRPHLGAIRRGISHAGRQQQVDAERTVGQITHRPNAAADFVAVEPRTAENSHAAGLAHRRHQLGWRGVTFHAHAGEENRILDLQVITEARVQHALAHCSLFLGFTGSRVAAWDREDRGWRRREDLTPAPSGRLPVREK